MAIDTQTHNITQIHAGSQSIAEAHIWTGTEWKKVWPDAPLDEVVIGTQTWKIRNLDIDDGNGGVYTYDAAEYGRLYTYAAAVRIAATVSGFHLPSDAEWTTQCNYLGGLSVAGKKLKEAGSAHWLFTGGTNSSGFTAVGGGLYVSAVQNVNNDGRYWSSTPVNTTSSYAYIMKAASNSVVRGTQTNTWGLSVRLIKN